MEAVSEHKHPIGLWPLAISYSLFMFVFGTFVSLLVVHAIDDLGFSTKQAYSLFTAYFGLTLAFCLPGGYISGKLGHKYCAFLGLVFALLGSFIFGLKGVLFAYLGLASFIVGYGLCTPAFFCLLGAMYCREDRRRDSGHTLFYLIFNVGVAVAAISQSYIMQLFGYQAAFITAGVALFVAMCMLSFTFPLIHPHENQSIDPQVKLVPWLNTLSILVIGLLFIPIFILLLKYTQLNNLLLWILMLGAIVWVLWLAQQQKQRRAKQKLYAYIVLVIIVIVFIALYSLEPSLMTVFIKKHVDRHIFGNLVPASAFYSLDPIGVVIFGLMFGWLWRYLAEHNKDPSPPTKFALSLYSIGIGFVVFAIGIVFANFNTLVDPFWIVFGYVFLTAAEILIMPIGIAMVGRLSPAGKEGLLMGIWTLAWGFANVITNYLARMSVPLATDTLVQTNQLYFRSFLRIGITGIAMGVIATLLIAAVKKLIQQPK